MTLRCEQFESVELSFCLRSFALMVEFLQPRLRHQSLGGKQFLLYNLLQPRVAEGFFYSRLGLIVLGLSALRIVA